METKRKYTCPTCNGTGRVAAWDRGCEFSADPANHYDVECPRPDCRFGRVECELSELEVFDLCSLPAFIADCTHDALTDADFEAFSAAIRTGDLAALGGAFLEAIVREACQRAEDAANARCISTGNAIARLEKDYAPTVRMAA